MTFSKRKWILTAVLGMAVSGSALARETEAFDTALHNRDFAGAAREIERLAGPEGAARRGGPLLDAYYGRYFAALAQVDGEPYLLRAMANARNSTDRDALALELAQLHEVGGLAAKAEADYRQLATSATGPGVRSAAILALTRRTLGDTPDEAVGLLMPLISASNPSSVRWEAQLLLSRAYAIQGKAPESRAALLEAWKAAPTTDRPAYAIAVTAMDMSLDRVTGNDRDIEIGLVSVGQSDSWFNGAAQLPVCNDIIRPEDSVTISVSGDHLQRPLYSLIRASRPEISRQFMEPLAAAYQGVEGSAFIVKLRCRSAPAATVRYAGTAVPTLAGWLGRRAYYPPLLKIDSADGDALTQLTNSVQLLQSRMAPDAPELTPLMLTQAWMQARQSNSGNPAKFAEARALAERAIASLSKAGAPPEIILQLKAQTAFVFEPSQNAADVTGPLAAQFLEAILSRADATPIQALGAIIWMNSCLQLRPAQRLAMIDRVIAFLDSRHVSMTDPLRQQIELGRASVMRDIGTLTGLSQRLTASGIGSDLCSAAEHPASFPPSAVTFNSEDYPKDLLKVGVTGYDVIEFSLDPEGKVEAERIIASQPPGLFDDITIEKLKVARLLPAQQNGHPVACKAATQTIRWQLPGQVSNSGIWDGTPYVTE